MPGIDTEKAIQFTCDIWGLLGSQLQVIQVTRLE